MADPNIEAWEHYRDGNLSFDPSQSLPSFWNRNALLDFAAVNPDISPRELSVAQEFFQKALDVFEYGGIITNTHSPIDFSTLSSRGMVGDDFIDQITKIGIYEVDVLNVDLVRSDEKLFASSLRLNDRLRDAGYQKLSKAMLIIGPGTTNRMQVDFETGGRKLPIRLDGKELSSKKKLQLYLRNYLNRLYESAGINQTIDFISYWHTFLSQFPQKCDPIQSEAEVSIDTRIGTDTLLDYTNPDDIAQPISEPEGVVQEEQYFPHDDTWILDPNGDQQVYYEPMGEAETFQEVIGHDYNNENLIEVPDNIDTKKEEYMGIDPPKKRGRPKGSRNKPKDMSNHQRNPNGHKRLGRSLHKYIEPDEDQVFTEEPTDEPIKPTQIYIPKKRGRPPGSLNQKGRKNTSMNLRKRNEPTSEDNTIKRKQTRRFKEALIHKVVLKMADKRFDSETFGLEEFEDDSKYTNSFINDAYFERLIDNELNYREIAEIRDGKAEVLTFSDTERKKLSSISRLRNTLYRLSEFGLPIRDLASLFLLESKLDIVEENRNLTGIIIEATRKGIDETRLKDLLALYFPNLQSTRIRRPDRSEFFWISKLKPESHQKDVYQNP